MSNEVCFEPFSSFPRGTFYALLCDAYSFEPGYRATWDEQWKQEDAFFYDHLDIADHCGFVTVLDGKAIGFICWDPRSMPEYTELGHNCISAAYKGQGYGKIQLLEALRRIRKTEPRFIRVTTDEDLIPAQKNYESAGFHFVRYRDNPWNASYAGRLMDYEIAVKKATDND